MSYKCLKCNKETDKLYQYGMCAKCTKKFLEGLEQWKPEKNKEKKGKHTRKE